MFLKTLKRCSSSYNANSELIVNIAPENIRNFSIIAHIDHGKSTLADRLLEYSGTIKPGGNKQILDKLLVEKSRGITVKAQTASMFYTHNNTKYLLNLIDTPGHVDFSYEVSRSLAACQGTLLLVDACQGIQAQTIANYNLASELDLSVIPVINKVDLPAAYVPEVEKQIKSQFWLDDVRKISAKTGLGVPDLFIDIISKIPSPDGKVDLPFSGLLFDTWWDKYVGVVCLVAVKDGKVSRGDRIVSAHTQQVYDITNLGIMYPDPHPTHHLTAGQVGFITMNMKSTRDAFIGDTFYHVGKPTKVFPGFQPSQPMVFAGLYPVDSNEYQQLVESIDRLTLNDSSVTVQKETSATLGQGFRLGFLGTLHMDVFRQRLEEEHDAAVINTVPTVPYICKFKDGTEITIKNPAEFPDRSESQKIDCFMEPMVDGTLVFPDKYMGKMISTCAKHRGEQMDLFYVEDDQMVARYRFPSSEILTSFYDAIKSGSSGYATFDYKEDGYKKANLVKVVIILNKKEIDALSCVCHKVHAHNIARDWVSKLKKLIKRQLFEIDIQASVQGKIVASEKLKAFRKDVTQKIKSGSDITRKMKLLDRQKAGKKRRQPVAGGVELSQDIFLALMKKEDPGK